MKEAGTKPELEVYDMGGLYNVLFMKDAGLFVEPLHFQFVFGVLGGMPFSTRNFGLFLETIPEDATLSSCGVGPAPFAAAYHAVGQRRAIRVGLEDNIWIKQGQARARGLLRRRSERMVGVADKRRSVLATPPRCVRMLWLRRKRRSAERHGSRRKAGSRGSRKCEYAAFGYDLGR